MYIKKHSGYVLKNNSNNDCMLRSNYFRLNNINFITSKTKFEDLTVIMKHYQIRLTLEYFLDSVSSIQYGLYKNKDYKLKEDSMLNRIEKVATKISEDFFQAALKTYLNKYYQTVFKYQDYTGVYSDFPAPSEDMFNSISNKKKEIYEKCKRKLNQQMDNLSNYGNRGMMIKNSTKECESIWREIHEAIHIYEIQGGLAAIHMLGLEYYQVVNYDHYAACERCKELHRVGRKVSEAVMGVNLPPIHPNCRCTIGSYVLEDNGIDIDFMKFLSKLSNLGIAGTSTILYNQDWYRNLLLGFIKQVEPIAVKDKNHVRLPDFQRNVFINNNKIYNSSEEDNRLLSLMKKRDIIGLTDEEYKDAILLMHNPNSTVKFFEPYSYYTVGRDVTDEVDKIINDIKLEYSQLVGAGLKSMPTFYKLVTGNSRLDLKNRAPYKTNSTYLHNGKLVDADYLGNFVYGHIGRVFGIEEVILFSAAGYKQREDGTSSSEFYRTYYDDPKDQEAILEGIYYYEKMHDSTKTE